MAEVPTDKGKELKMYRPLVEGLTSLVRNIPDDRRPTFNNHAHQTMRFPFAMCDYAEHSTMPDVIATIPGLPYIPPADRWRNVALVFEAKATAEQDPMVRHAAEHEETLIQLAKSARNIMFAQGRLFAFVVGIYGHQARIFRFDRAGAVCSPSFNYAENPKLLHEFLCRFLNPTLKACVVVGGDPTSNLGTHEERTKAQELAAEHDPSYKYTQESRKAVRKFVVTEGKVEKTYLAYKLISVNPRLFSRATTIWEAFELDEAGEATGRRVIIKEAWRQFVRPSEIDFYLMVQETMEEAEEGATLAEYGVAKLVCSDDLGLREAKALNMKAKPRAKETEYVGDFPRLKVPCARVLGHRTVSAGRYKKGLEHVERAQMRLVFETIGKPIIDFDSTYELVSALRDAIEGHRRAYEAGVIHRDVSRGNVMIGRRADGTSFGFIHDFDYASNWRAFLAKVETLADLKSWEEHARKEYGRDWQKRWGNSDANSGDELPTVVRHSDRNRKQHTSRDLNNERAHRTSRNSRAHQPPSGSKKDEHGQAATADPNLDHKQRTGTLHFMAVEVLDPGFNVTHEARHDLESFFWLLVWIILRHTAYDKPNSDQAWHALFDGTTIDSCQSLKMKWLIGPPYPIEIEDNPMLAWLLERFRKLCQKNFNSPDLAKQCMTHKDVLDLFNLALQDRDAWPENDRAKPWTPPKRDAHETAAMAKRSGQLRTKGTLTYTSQGAGRSASQRDTRRRAEKRPAAPSPTSDSDAQSDDGQAGANVPDVGTSKRGATSGAGRGKRQPAGLHALTVSPYTSGGHEVPPSTNSDSAGRQGRRGSGIREEHVSQDGTPARSKDPLWRLADPVFKPSCYRARCEAEEGE
ncbi:uncharacterized protein B0H18DRAFT_1105601 [Fomitopsis serialis]|uniref:uncharacterized protein n=1 Tax=Fomitopsis serialis TaxID=139415 RepID=UPI002008BAB1|nr:uncharacterized protein B0H18DRAFT_1105601 [Neoantrodia serialis]KAH9922496.1 hypothetical protein B0H18DRAFT_1105601 [Neoantrodia serialis]